MERDVKETWPFRGKQDTHVGPSRDRQGRGHWNPGEAALEVEAGRGDTQWESGCAPSLQRGSELAGGPPGGGSRGEARATHRGGGARAGWTPGGNWGAVSPQGRSLLSVSWCQPHARLPQGRMGRARSAGVRTGSANLPRLWERDPWAGGVHHWAVHTGLKARHPAVMTHNRWGLATMLGEGGLSVGGTGASP